MTRQYQTLLVLQLLRTELYNLPRNISTWQYCTCDSISIDYRS